jgi:hypothetical protein
MLAKIFTFLFSALSFTALGQQYILDQTPEVIINNTNLKFPWVGGLNSAQINMIDLDRDGLDDIIAFERSTLELFTFIATEKGSYKYAPEYAALFPDIYGWIITRDFNGDGKKDLFTADPLGIQLYMNELPSGFKKYPVSPLLSKSNTGPVNIYVTEQDLPAIEDVDGDGDLDIVSLQFSGTTLEFHKNLQVEQGLEADTLVFQKETENWGNIRICSCDNIVDNEDNCPESGRIEHSVGHSLLLLNLDGDEDMDLAFSDNQCYNLHFLENTGTAENAVLNKKSLERILPETQNMPYPSPTYADVDHDGNKDLITSPNNIANFRYSLDFSASVWFYKNTGTTGNPSFTLRQQDLLQNEMIDIGQNSYPVFHDIDNDGDMDMFVGKLVDYRNNFRTGLSYYENVGSYGNPVFKLVTEDVFSFSSFSHYNIKPQFVDVTGDRRPELVFSATGLVNGITSIYYFKNTGQVTFSSDFEVETILEAIPFNSNYLINDVNDNQKVDLLITTPAGVQRFEKSNDDYKLIEEGYLNLPANTHNLSIDDIDGDGAEDLLYSVLRKAYVIYDFKYNATTEELTFASFPQHPSMPLGHLLQIQPVKLLGNDLPELVVGNNTGGLKIYRSKNAVSEPEKDPFILFPTPADQKENLNFQATRNMLLYVVSADGKVVIGPEFVPSYKSFEVQLRNFATGMYIIKALIDKDTSWQRKFVVVN